MKFFSNKLQEEQVNGELECLVLASDGLWDVVENEVIILPQFSHSSKQAVALYVNLYNCMKASQPLLFTLGLHSYFSQNGQLCSYWYLHLINNNVFDAFMKKEAVSLGKSEDAPEPAARKLTEIAYSRGSADNITCIVVQFHHDESG